MSEYHIVSSMISMTRRVPHALAGQRRRTKTPALCGETELVSIARISGGSPLFRGQGLWCLLLLIGSIPRITLRFAAEPCAWPLVRGGQILYSTVSVLTGASVGRKMTSLMQSSLC
ncbi:hypothetical protein GGI42DRAFT_345478 [Trichoderma sp. SZMC 28013]